MSTYQSTSGWGLKGPQELKAQTPVALESLDDIPFDPTVKDGRSADGLQVPRANWANTIDEPPFEAYSVTCGITFTFGGLRITRDSGVLDNDGNVIPGLYAAGELVGGIFYFNYPGGSGLTAGAVFGRIAGTSAGARAAEGKGT